ncbi:MAG TPA: hemolysin family protein [Thermodesulfobacteriota bacterium]
MGSVYVEIVTVLVLIVLNGVFAMSEMALVAARRSRLEALAESGSRPARAALGLAADPGRFLSTVQIGITLVGILAGAVSGATIADRFGDYLDTFPALRPYGDTIAIGLVVAATTYLSLIVGELVPKQIALGRPEAIAMATARPMGRLSRVAGPLVTLLDVSTEAVLRVLRIERRPEEAVTEEEIRTLITQGTRAGVLQPAERDMLEGVMRLADRPVRTIMTPRPEVVWIDLADSPAEVRRKVLGASVSRFPLVNGRLDEVVGIVEARDVLARGEPAGADLRAVMRPVLAVHEGTPALRVLERFRSASTTLALVVDEFGGVEGVVTASDVLEAIVGELPEAGREAGPRAVDRGDGSWLVDGLMPVDEVRERVPGIVLPEARGYSTLAGFVLAQLGHIPRPGEAFTHGGFRFEVVDMDGRRVDVVLISPLAPAGQAAGDDGEREVER